MTFLSRLAAAACVAVCTLVHAATPVEPGPDIDAGLNPGSQKPLWELGLGVAGLRLPDYRGSDQSRGYLLPLPYIVYRGTWLKADRDGARALLLDTQRVKVDVSVAASTPTRSSDNTAREGMPNLPAVGEIGPNLNYTIAGSVANRWRLDLRLPLRAAVTLQRSPEFIGTTFSPHLNLDLGGVAGGWNLGLLTGPLFADRKYHEHFYGVDAAYATSTRPAYQAHGGYAGWQALAATSRRFGNTWVGAFVRYDSLRGASFEDSPLVRSRSAVTAGFGVSWILKTSSELVASSD
jgi:outer membrane scaffolding protein for murein synthesis (MipA/OmpV family)